MEKKYKSVLEMEKDLGESSDFYSSLEKEIKGQRVARAIFSIRNKKGLTQKELSEKMKITQSAVSKLESSPDKKITIGQLLAVSRAMGTTTELLIFDKEMKSVDKVKYHWFKIKAELDNLISLCNGDKEIQKGVQQFTEEAFINITSGLIKQLERVKGGKQEHNKGLEITGIVSPIEHKRLLSKV